MTEKKSKEPVPEHTDAKSTETPDQLPINLPDGSTAYLWSTARFRILRREKRKSTEADDQK